MLLCRFVSFVMFCMLSEVLLEDVPTMEMNVEDSTVSPPPGEANNLVEVKNNVVISLNDKNVDYVSGNYEFVLVLFYVKWCRFSMDMLPIFDEVVIELQKQFPNSKKFAITKLDCDIFEHVCDNYGIVKFPTVKVMRHGSIEKLEYRKERTVEAMVKYVGKELVDPTIAVNDAAEVTSTETDKRRILGFLSKKRPEEEEIFRKAATHFKNLCLFIFHLSDSDNATRIVFQPDDQSPQDEAAEMPLNETLTFPYLRDWANYKCVPYVREITFENAEELTEEGLPLLILFYRPENDTELVKKFKRVVTAHFVDDIIGRKINFVTANGHLFEHPLHHLGKSLNDLPLIAIDSLKHMFSYPGRSEEDLWNLEKLRRYLADFYSQKLHFKFHNLAIFEDESGQSEHEGSPSMTNVPRDQYQQASSMESDGPQGPSPHGPPGGEEGDEDEGTIVKDSDFIKLYPSDKRYTLKKRVRDEL